MLTPDEEMTLAAGVTDSDQFGLITDRTESAAVRVTAVNA